MTNTKQVTVELLPCPFCGGSAQLMKYGISCTNCDASSKPSSEKNPAIEAWNRRAAPTSGDHQLNLFMRQTSYLQRALTKAVSLPAGELPSEHDYITVMLNGNVLVKAQEQEK